MAPFPDVPGFRRLRNRSVRELNVAIVQLRAMNPSDETARKLYDAWISFLQSPVGRHAPDSALYPAYKAFSIGYHYAWRSAAKKPTITPDIGVVTLLAEDLIETADEFDRAIGGAIDQVERRARETVSRAADKAAGTLAIVVIAVVLLSRRRR